MRGTSCEVNLSSFAQTADMMALNKPSVGLLALPVELIRAIFWQCLEPNLLTCCDAIASKLASDDIYHATLIHAFYKRNEPINYLGQTITHIDPGAHTESILRGHWPQPVDPSEQIRLQEAVFNSPWCTHAKLERLMKSLSLAMLKDVFKARSQHFHRDDKVRMRHWLQGPPNKTKPKGIRLTTKHDQTIRLKSESRDREQISFTWIRAAYPNARPYCFIEPFDFRVIPSTLMAEPGWTDERLRYLCMIASAYMQQCDDKALHEGMRHAINEGNVKALLVLCWIDGMWPKTYQPATPLPRDLFTMVAEKFSFFHGSRVQRNEQIETSMRLFVLLLRTSPVSMPIANERVLRWAGHLEACGDSRPRELGRIIAAWGQKEARRRGWGAMTSRLQGTDKCGDFAKMVDRMELVDTTEEAAVSTN